MIRVLVVADTGTVMATVTRSLAELPDVEIVAYANGRTRLDRVLATRPVDVVLVDEMDRPGLGAERVADVHAAVPAVPVVGLCARAESAWTVGGLRAGATAVVPRDLPAATLRVVLREAVGAAPALRSAA